MRIATAPSAYVAGEESALTHWLNGGEAKPVLVPPRPFEKGVKGRPTLVNNVETLAHLALLARFGAGWFGAIGTRADPGTTLVTLSGDVARPGVYEGALGSPLAQAVKAARPTQVPQALLVGGDAGTWIPAAVAGNLTLDSVSLPNAGATMGCGVIAALGSQSCGLVETAAIVDWMASQSAGHVRRAVAACPTLALLVRKVDEHTSRAGAPR